MNPTAKEILGERAWPDLESALSRESVFLANNLVLVGLCFVVFWGTFFPLIAEAVTGSQRNIGPPVYERFIVPLAVLAAWELLARFGGFSNFMLPTPSTVARATPFSSFQVCRSTWSAMPA